MKYYTFKSFLHIHSKNDMEILFLHIKGLFPINP